MFRKVFILSVVLMLILAVQAYAQQGKSGTARSYTLSVSAQGTGLGNVVSSIPSASDHYTVLMLTFDGPDGSTTFTDDSYRGHDVTAQDGAHIDTAHSRFGGASAHFDGRKDYLRVPDSLDWDFGNRDFTIDFWVRFAKVPTVNQGFARSAHCSTNGFYGNWIFGLSRDNVLQFVTYDGKSNLEYVAGGWTPRANKWYHVALTRSGTTARLFVDGVKVGDGKITKPLTDGGLWLALGYSGNSYLNGSIDEFRISKGIARWTENFTPPSLPYFRISDGGIDCGDGKRGVCAKGYAEDTKVTLTAAPDSSSDFMGWSGGGCPVRGECTVTMSADTTVTATFEPDSNPPVTAASPAGGIYIRPQSVEFTCDDGTGSGCETNGTYYCIGAGCNPTTAYTGTIAITNSGSTDLRFRSIDIKGNGEEVRTERYTILIPDIKTSPLWLDFGGTPTGRSSEAKVITVSNYGVANLDIGAVSIGGKDASDFKIQADNCSKQAVPPMGSCTVDVVSSPATAGVKIAKISIPSNDLDTSTIDVTLGASSHMDIKTSDLEGLTLRDLWLMRNEIFARHGRPFKTYELHAYFMSKGLEPDQEYSVDRLTPGELKNIELITAKENELLKKNYIKGPSGKDTVNLGNILNLFQYAEFTGEQKGKLSANGFVVTPARHGQLFHVYEKNSYLGIPSFITTDSVLQLYSIFFDFTLRRVEERYLMNTLKTLTEEMMKYSEEIYLNAEDNLIKEAARSNLAYYTVPYYLLTEDWTKVHPDVRDMVLQELELVKKHEKIAPPPILMSNKPEYTDYATMRFYWPDYSQFIPRGHYTRSEELKKYFMASLWLGLYHMHPQKDFEHETVQGLLTTHLLYTKAVDGRPLIELWKDIYEPTVFYVGLSDDIGPDDFKGVIDKVYGKIPEVSEDPDRSKLNTFQKLIKEVKDIVSSSTPAVSDYADRNKLAEVQKLLYEIYEEKTKIKFVWYPETPGPDAVRQGPRFMLMGQRYIPDSEVLQRLVGGSRAFPMGLDVMAVFRSRLAKDLMLTKYKDTWDDKFPVYPEEVQGLTKEFGELSESDWKKNLYFNWIWTLKSLIDLSSKKNYPFFTQTRAWEAKNLNTSLASWSQLRHHTILYGKQSFFAAECGGEDDKYVLWVPEPPKGYVEPNVEFYRRMLEMLELSEGGLKERNLLDPLTVESFEEFRDIVEFLDGVAEKELKGEPRSLEEYERIRTLGAKLDNLTYKIMEGNSFDERDRIIPVIADVHTAYIYGVMNVLEEAVGYANEIYVVVEDEGKLRLTRGAVMSYYEFKWPAKDRLTDGNWQKILKDKKEPPVPEWTDMFISKEPSKEQHPVYVPDPSGLPHSSTEPGWKTLYYGGC